MMTMMMICESAGKQNKESQDVHVGQCVCCQSL